MVKWDFRRQGVFARHLSSGTPGHPVVVCDGSRKVLFSKYLGHTRSLLPIGLSFPVKSQGESLCGRSRGAISDFDEIPPGVSPRGKKGLTGDAI